MARRIDLDISLKKRYSIHIGFDIWKKLLKHFRASYSPRKIFIIIDENVNKLHGDKIKSQCGRYFQACHIIEIKAGEKSKSLNVWKYLLDELLQKKVERATPLLAVGGGVTGDLAGFVAASALRGIPLIHMPTSLLAMVDSSIGGKTGVNHTNGKNLIGAFYQPDIVFAHLSFLKTLPREEWVNGLSEILKYAAIRRPGLFDQLETATENFCPNEQWEQIIYRSAQIKSEVVEADAHEAGQRAILNFGHTFGHAIEKLAGFKAVSHGEAVFAGMLAAVHLSKKLGAPVDPARFHPFKTLYNINLEGIRSELLIEAMYTDKKVKNETLRFVLLKEWGEAFIKKTNDKRLLKDAWQAALDELKTSNHQS